MDSYDQVYAMSSSPTSSSDILFSVLFLVETVLVLGRLPGWRGRGRSRPAEVWLGDLTWGVKLFPEVGHGSLFKRITFFHQWI